MNKSDQSRKIQNFILKNLSKHPRDIISFTNKTLNISKTTALRHLRSLIKNYKVLKTGSTKNICYILPENNNIIVTFKLSNNLNEFDIFKTYFNKSLSNLKPNILNICEYGLTEMINNAIDHSYGTNLTVELICKKNNILLIIKDDGVGALKRIADLLKTSEYQEAVLQLTKGKFTSDPYNHTGEGIFFTSRIFDEFKLFSNNLCFTRINYPNDNDWFLEKISFTKGTSIHLTIDQHSNKEIKDVFLAFQDPKTMKFNKTDIIVSLSKFDEERYISRSQAKRILKNLENFKTINLDFKHVKVVGQGFVDEIFRVFANNHKDVTINYINANEDVLFMIQRSS